MIGTTFLQMLTEINTLISHANDVEVGVEIFF